MIILEDEQDLITNFITDSIEDFKTQKGKFNSVGIYCCSWAGWLSLSFNIVNTISDTSFNCPDFEIVEFNLLELGKWSKEYEKEAPTYIFEGKTTVFNFDLGDEAINEVFFKFLSSIILNLKNDIQVDVLLQMLDSEFFKVF